MDLESTVRHVSRDSPKAALRLAASLLEHVDLLASFPNPAWESHSGILPTSGSCSTHPTESITVSMKAARRSRFSTSGTAHGKIHRCSCEPPALDNRDQGKGNEIRRPDHGDHRSARARPLALR